MCINYFINTCHLFTLYDSCVTISMHKVHHCTCISTSLYPPSQFVRTNFSTSFCCSVLHISYIFSIYCYSVAAVITVCAVSVCVSSHQPSFLIQHLVCSTPTSKSLHSPVPLVRPLYWSVLWNRQVRTYDQYCTSTSTLVTFCKV